MAGTGTAPLPDVGVLSYNGVVFSSLYTSQINGGVVADEAKRTTKYMEWGLEVDGTVTLNPGDLSTDATWANIRKKLSVHGAPLIYRGQGFGGLVVNVPGGQVWDVAFGPVPEVIYFQPLGAGRSAMIRWRVKCHIPELSTLGGGGRLISNPISPGLGGPTLINNTITPPGPVLQYNYEASVSYDDEDYSTISIRGTLEIPMTRTAVNNRALPNIVDAYRSTWMNIQVDLTLYRVTRRNFSYSRDKRTADFEFVAEELPPMGLPPGASNARGTMSVRPARVGGYGSGNIQALTGHAWSVSLRATYTIRKDWPPRAAAMAFYALLWYRIQSSYKGEFSPTDKNAAAKQQALTNNLNRLLNGFQAGAAAGGFGTGPAPYYQRLFASIKAFAPPPGKARSIIITDFGYDEGLYLDSKTITFSASWWLVANLRSLLEATGTWQWLDGSSGGNAWATSVADISGWSSWLQNRLDPSADVIVDMGGGSPPLAPPIQ